MPPLLEARDVTKRFPGVLALDRVRFDLRPGEIHALCGENGAGKSTLIKLLSGLHPHGSYEGTLLLDGVPARFRGAADAHAAGISVIHQELALVDELSVAENIFLGDEPRRGLLVDWDGMLCAARGLLARFNLDIDPGTLVGDLGVGRKQLVEIARALGRRGSRILILDEPTAALTDREAALLLDVLRDLRRRGISCIYISHRLEEVFAIADRITVLRDGMTADTSDAAATTPAAVIRLMVGREIGDFFPRAAPPPGGVLLDVRSLSVAEKRGGPPRLRDVSFEVRAGEVLGIGGLMGAGRTELLMHLFGAWGIRLSGSVAVAGRACDADSPAEALRSGIALVPEDRRRHGLVPGQSVGFNLSLASLSRLCRRGLVDEETEERASRRFFDTLRIKAPSTETPVDGLSGGNQQKVVLGKSMMTEPRVVLLDEPTRGIDVGAKVEVYELVNRLTADGCAVVLVSSELPELMGMSDRILMLASGRTGGVFSRAEATQERLLAAALAR